VPTKKVWHPVEKPWKENDFYCSNDDEIVYTWLTRAMVIPLAGLLMIVGVVVSWLFDGTIVGRVIGSVLSLGILWCLWVFVVGRSSKDPD
jgi:hypothetical protein